MLDTALPTEKIDL